MYNIGDKLPNPSGFVNPSEILDIAYLRSSEEGTFLPDELYTEDPFYIGKEVLFTSQKRGERFLLAKVDTVTCRMFVWSKCPTSKEEVELFNKRLSATEEYLDKNSKGEISPTVEEDAAEFFEQDAKSPHLLDLGYSMLGWLDGLESRPDNDNLPPIVTLLMAVQYDKEGGYGSSWKGKGEYRGIMANIDRKYDRLDKMTMDEIEGKIESLQQIEGKLETLKNNTGNTGALDVGESKIDAIADLANYCLLYMTYVKEKYPKTFDKWVDKNVPAYLREKITFL